MSTSTGWHWSSAHAVRPGDRLSVGVDERALECVGTVVSATPWSKPDNQPCVAIAIMPLHPADTADPATYYLWEHARVYRQYKDMVPP